MSNEYEEFGTILNANTLEEAKKYLQKKSDSITTTDSGIVYHFKNCAIQVESGTFRGKGNTRSLNKIFGDLVSIVKK